MAKDWKERLGVVFSTNPEFEYEGGNDDEAETLPPNRQKLVVSIDKKQRKGKVVTLVDGFQGTEDDLKELAKMLKSNCGVGGSAKEGQIMIQGDFKARLVQLLADKGYGVKQKN